MASQAHLVGSVNLPNARSVFEAIARHAGGVVDRLPDGETDERAKWVLSQAKVFETADGLERVAQDDTVAEGPVPRFRPTLGAPVDRLRLPRPGYADFAKASFGIFSELKAEGVIRADARFQVSLPTPLASVLVFIDAPSQAAVEPAVERALHEELDRILDAIPHDELAIQWDVAGEIGGLEGTWPMFFSPVLDGVVARLSRLASWVPEDVSLGFHLCYGDSGGAHFTEPDDLRRLVEVAGALSAAVARDVDWIHMPVPIERDDDPYFAPLADLRLRPETQLYLGLLHKEDGLGGARQRIEAAKRHRSDFGVGTECGMARDAQVSDVPALLSLHAQAAELL